MRLSKLLGSVGLASVLLAAHHAQAKPVTLSSVDGTVSVHGELIEVTHQQYLVKTSIGSLRIDRVGVSCAGEGCPDARTLTPPSRVRGFGPAMEVLRPVARPLRQAQS